MFPGGFIDGGEKANDVILMGPFIQKMSESAGKRNYDYTEAKIKYVHVAIIALTVCFGVDYGIIIGGSVAEWLKAHDSKSCGRVTVSEVRILSLPPRLQ